MLKKVLPEQKIWKLQAVAILFWYIALFPGRLGFDYALALEMMRKGESTNLWTGLYFWLLKLLTLNGRFIWLISLLSILALSWSIRKFVISYPFKAEHKERIIFYIYCTPIFGAFGVNVSHDVLQVAGLILAVSLLIDISNKQFVQTWKFHANFILSVTLLLTTQSGVFISLFLILLLAIRKFKLLSFLGIVTILIVTPISNLGIQRIPTSSVLIPAIFDIKCIVQHKDTILTEKEKIYLEKLAPLDEWKKEISCGFGDDMIRAMPNFNYQNLRIEREFIIFYTSLVAKKPLIAILGHIQRSRGALPPPFFQGPQNQVPLDVSIPIGKDTNDALQTGTELLHPSVDDPKVNVEVMAFKPLEGIAQFSMFLINQASWFWGWGALWFWPILIFSLRLTKYRPKQLMEVFSPILLLHLLLFIVTPGPFGRYVMATIILGCVISIGFVISYLDQRLSVTALK